MKCNAHAPVIDWNSPRSFNGIRSAVTIATSTWIAPDPTPCIAMRGPVSIRVRTSALGEHTSARNDHAHARRGAGHSGAGGEEDDSAKQNDLPAKDVREAAAHGEHGRA